MASYIPALLDDSGGHEATVTAEFNAIYTGSKALLTDLCSICVVDALNQGAGTMARPYTGELPDNLKPSSIGDYLLFDPTSGNQFFSGNTGYGGMRRFDITKTKETFEYLIIHCNSFVDRLIDLNTPVTADKWQKAGATGIGYNNFLTVPDYSESHITSEDSRGVVGAMARFMNINDATSCTHTEFINAAKVCLESSTGSWNMFEGYGVFDEDAQNRIISYLQGNIVTVYGQSVQGISAIG